MLDGVAPRLYVVGMAAEPVPDDPGRTRYLHLEGVPFGGRLLGPVARPPDSGTAATSPPTSTASSPRRAGEALRAAGPRQSTSTQRVPR